MTYKDMNPLEKVDMETACYGACGNSEVAKGFFKVGWIAARDHERNPNKTTAYKYGQNLPVSTAVLSKRELVAAMALQGILTNPVLWERNDETQIAEMALAYADKLLEKINS